MNWKRGALRLYIVAWVALAIIGALITYSDSQVVFRDRDRVKQYLRTHHATEADLRKWTAARASTTPHLDYDSLVLALGGIPDEEANRETDDVLETFNSDNYQHPFLMLLLPWGLWLILCGVVPLVLLGVAHWVIKGFERTRTSP